MKQITAYIQPFMADKVTDALRDACIHGMSMLPCQCFGHLASEPELRYEEQANPLGLVKKVKLEIVCSDSDKNSVMAIIQEHAHTGHQGDGKIFVSTIDETQDIRTGTTSDAV